LHNGIVGECGTKSIVPRYNPGLYCFENKEEIKSGRWKIFPSEGTFLKIMEAVEFSINSIS
jgi:hypothetical protein